MTQHFIPEAHASSDSQTSPSFFLIDDVALGVGLLVLEPFGAAPPPSGVALGCAHAPEADAHERSAT